MAKLSVTVKQQNVGFGTEKEEMFISKVQHATIYNLDEIAYQVALESGVNKRQVKAAVNAFVDAMIVFLKSGSGVSLDGFGTFLPMVKSISSKNPNEVGVRRVRLSFRPHKKLWEAVGDISYDTYNPYTTTSDSNESDEETDNGSDSGSSGENPLG